MPPVSKRPHADIGSHIPGRSGVEVPRVGGGGRGGVWIGAGIVEDADLSINDHLHIVIEVLREGKYPVGMEKLPVIDRVGVRRDGVGLSIERSELDPPGADRGQSASKCAKPMHGQTRYIAVHIGHEPVESPADHEIRVGGGDERVIDCESPVDEDIAAEHRGWRGIVGGPEGAHGDIPVDAQSARPTAGHGAGFHSSGQDQIPDRGAAVVGGKVQPTGAADGDTDIG